MTEASQFEPATRSIEILRDYWFDWRAYHPDTAIFSVGLIKRAS
jgi:hypothetical protein